MELSLKDLRELIGAGTHLPDKDYGIIVLIIRNGFVFVGRTHRRDGIGYLSGAQVRYWKARDGGLPEFARGGPVEGDRLDKIDGELEFPWSESNVIGVLPCGQTWNSKI